MIHNVHFVSRTTAQNMEPGTTPIALISITTPGDDFPEFSERWASICRLCFHDVDAWKEDDFIGFSPQHAFFIIQFVEDIAPVVDTIIVHCDAGISRSAGVAKWIAEKYNLPFNHRYQLYNSRVYRLLTICSMDEDHNGTTDKMEETG